MACFDVYAHPEASGYLLDVQATMFDRLNTRVVVPLLPSDAAPTPAARLNPIFRIGGADAVMMTQWLAAVPAAMLGRPLTTLEHHRTEIVDAVDFLLHGF